MNETWQPGLGVALRLTFSGFAFVGDLNHIEIIIIDKSELLKLGILKK